MVLDSNSSSVAMRVDILKWIEFVTCNAGCESATIVRYLPQASVSSPPQVRISLTMVLLEISEFATQFVRAENCRWLRSNIYIDVVAQQFAY
jgi:hypothetical protein